MGKGVPKEKRTTAAGTVGEGSPQFSGNFLGMDFDPHLQNALEESDKLHSRTAHISFDEYRKQRYTSLNAFVMARKAIYLDMNFWIWLRTPDQSPKPEATVQLLELLRKGVKAGLIFCPVSYSVLLELEKQPIEKRLAQARLMDELSVGVSIRNPFDVAELEYIQFIVRHLTSLPKVKIDSVWAPIGHLVLEKYPYQKELPVDFMERTRKVMLDVSWEMRMEDYASMNMPIPTSKMVNKINSERKLNPRNGKSFERLFAEELDGELDALSPHIEESIKHLANFMGIPTKDAKLPERERRAAINLLREVTTRRLDNYSIPSQRIYAALHAAMRLDDRRDFKQNDLDDISHASVAAAYCNVFLTEKPLTSMLRLAAVQQIIFSNCAVICNMDSAIPIVAAYSDQPIPMS